MNQAHRTGGLDATGERAPASTWPAFEASWALLLDVDGTLLDHMADPAQVSVAGELAATLTSLRRLTDGAVALVSGRAIRDLDRLFAPIRFPCAGQHGLELRAPDGTLHRQDALAHLIDAASAELTRQTRGRTGIIVENKGLCLTVHYRRVPEEREQVRQWALAVIARLGDGLQLHEASHAFEIKPAGADKGNAILALMHYPPFKSRRPVFIGDDRSDEDGFVVVNDMGGISIKVGEGATRARWRADNPQAVRKWLHLAAAQPGAAAPS